MAKTATHGGVSRPLALVIVFWPAALWLLGALVAQLATLNGCTISARGGHECVVFGRDIAEQLYPLWALGIYLLGVVLWIPIGLVIVWVINRIRRSRQRAS